MSEGLSSISQAGRAKEYLFGLILGFIPFLVSAQIEESKTSSFVLSKLESRKTIPTRPVFPFVVGQDVKKENRHDLQKFKLGMGLGYGLMSGGLGGTFTYFEPMFRDNDNVALGFKFEAGGNTSNPRLGNSLFICSVTVNGQYYFTTNKFRPFIGLGLGYYSFNTETDLSWSSNFGIPNGPFFDSFGIYPRFGFDYDHFNFTVDYNLLESGLPAQPITDHGLPLTGRYTSPKDPSYLALKAGYSFGGGRK